MAISILPPTFGQPNSVVGVSDATLIGTTTIGNLVFAFLTVTAFQATSAQLAVLMCVNGVWGHVTYLPTLPVGIDAVGTGQANVVSVGSAIWVYVLGTDGNCYAQMWNGAVWLTTWMLCKPAEQTAKLTRVDHAAGPYVYVCDATHWWVYAVLGTAWVRNTTSPAGYSGTNNMPVFFLMGSNTACWLTISNNGQMTDKSNALMVVPKVYVNAGIITNRYLSITYQATWDVLNNATVATANDITDVAMVTVFGYNPDTPTQLRSWPLDNGMLGAALPYQNYSVVRIDLKGSQFTDGALCWVHIQGGRAQAPNGGGSNLAITADSSQANFNYYSTQAASPQGGSVSYAVTIKGQESPYWSFSSCSQSLP